MRNMSVTVKEAGPATNETLVAFTSCYRASKAKLSAFTSSYFCHSVPFSHTADAICNTYDITDSSKTSVSWKTNERTGYCCRVG
jgi:hypothetical protein